MTAASSALSAVSTRHPHRRYNPLVDEWVLCSPNRLERPWQGRVETTAPAAREEYDAGCYLCPGNARAGGARNPRYEQTFAFDNDFPALTAAPPAGTPRGADEFERDGLLITQPAFGRCRVLCFTPRHDLSLARMAVATIRPVIDTWADETTLLAQMPGAAYVQLFENRGELMGCSNPHPHAQLWMTGHVPSIPHRKAKAQRHYYGNMHCDLLGDYLAQESRDGQRVVYANAHWTVVVPFWAVWPFQTMLIPHRRVTALAQLDAAERDALAAALHQITARYDALFDCDFPYSMGWAPAPVGREDDPAWRLHAEFLPPLLRSSTVRKFLVGYEMMAEAQRDLTPEEAAERLRSCAI